MSTWAWIVIALAAAAVVVLVVAAVVARRRAEGKRQARLRHRYGPEYDRVASERGDRDAAAELERREQMRERLDIIPLTVEDRERYRSSWSDIQTQFVDEPSTAVMRADRLVAEVMRKRGYPMDEFEQRAADISVDHPQVVENYRSAHAIAVADAENRATTEDLRQAVVYYRALFEELLEAREPARSGSR